MRSFLFVGSCVAFLVLAGCAAGAGPEASTSDVRVDCSLVRCAMPLCAIGQVLVNRDGCCPECVGRPSRCATVLCAAIACPDGQQRVATPGDCCGHCQPMPAVAECNTTADCPVYACFACPCPVSECRGHQCFTTTADASTCGGAGI